MPFRFRLVAAFVLAALTGAALAAPPTVTLAERPLRVIRGTNVYTVGAGAPLAAGDLLETADAGLVVIDLGDGRSVGLGERTLAYLPEPAARLGGADAVPLVLRQGWLKLSGKGTQSLRVLGTHAGAAAREATLVAHATSAAGEVFVESGAAKLLLLDENGAASDGAALKPGQFARRSAGKPPAIAERPASDFVAAMPRSFRDPLPEIKAPAGKPPAPKLERAAEYADVAHWLTMPRAWRAALPRRFVPRLKDAAFRQALAGNLAAHPEWQPILYPPKPADTKPATRPAAGAY